MLLDNYVCLCYINLFDFELRCAVFEVVRSPTFGGHHGSLLLDHPVLRSCCDRQRLHDRPPLRPFRWQLRLQRRIRRGSVDPEPPRPSHPSGSAGLEGLAGPCAVGATGSQRARLVLLRELVVLARRNGRVLLAPGGVHGLCHSAVPIDTDPVPPEPDLFRWVEAGLQRPVLPRTVIAHQQLSPPTHIQTECVSGARFFM